MQVDVEHRLPRFAVAVEHRSIAALRVAVQVLFGDLRLVDSETGAMQEVTFGRFRLKGYQQTLQNYIQRLREFCQSRGINYFTVSSNTSLQELLLQQLRRAEVWG